MKKMTIVLLSVLILLSACSTTEHTLFKTAENNINEYSTTEVLKPSIFPSFDKNYLPEVTAEGYYLVELNENMLGGQSKEKAVTEFNKSEEVMQGITDIYINEEDITVYKLTTQQYEFIRNSAYELGKEENNENNAITKEIIQYTTYNTEDMSDIYIYMDLSDFNNRTPFITNFLYSPVFMGSGTYQIMCGVPKDDWHTKISIIDAETQEVLESREFPNPDMYKLEYYQ